MVKVCGNYWAVESLNIKEICKRKSVFVWSLQQTGDTSKIGWHMTYCISKES